jgi:hypothetical protein
MTSGPVEPSTAKSWSSGFESTSEETATFEPSLAHFASRRPASAPVTGRTSLPSSLATMIIGSRPPIFGSVTVVSRRKMNLVPSGESHGRASFVEPAISAVVAPVIGSSV